MTNKIEKPLMTLRARSDSGFNASYYHNTRLADSVDTEVVFRGGYKIIRAHVGISVYVYNIIGKNPKATAPMG